MEKSVQKRIQVVQLDGLVLLKIIKHAKQHMPEVVTGQLVGLEKDGRLEVTNCFPQPEDGGEGYQDGMMRRLRTVNMDIVNVGWYQSAFAGSFLEQSVLEAQYDFQKTCIESVVLVYDPIRTASGSLSIKAYRLTDRFMSVYSKGTDIFSPDSQNDFDATEIFEEIPIKVHNSHLIHGFLYELREQKTMNCTFDRLTMATHPFLEKNIGYVSSCVDGYLTEQSQHHHYQRQLAKSKLTQAAIQKRQQENEARLAEGKPALPSDDLLKLLKLPAKPSRVEALLLSNQISHYCGQVAQTCTLGFNKLYVVEALQMDSNEGKDQL